jgi:thiamine pyrophosphate-dependent acetolactate synthase large subunit-like protein
VRWAADLIINVGHDVIEKPPFFMVRGGPKVIHVNFYSAEVDSVYFPDHEVVGDIANAIWQLKEAMTPVRAAGTRNTCGLAPRMHPLAPSAPTCAKHVRRGTEPRVEL